MGFFLCTDGAERLLNIATNNKPQSNYVLKLFKNAATPAKTSVLGDFVESAFPGYAPISILPGHWTISQISGIGAQAIAVEQFTSTGNTLGETVYGWFLLDPAAYVGGVPKLIASGDLVPIYVPPVSGTFFIKVTVVLKVQDCQVCS